MELLEKIKSCKTRRELDELRYEIVKYPYKSPDDFMTVQKAFVSKQNSLERTGHTRWAEKYTLKDIIREHHDQEAKDEKES